MSHREEALKALYKSMWMVHESKKERFLMDEEAVQLREIFEEIEQLREEVAER